MSGRGSSRPLTTNRRKTSPSRCTPRSKRGQSRRATVDFPAAIGPVMRYTAGLCNTASALLAEALPTRQVDLLVHEVTVPLDVAALAAHDEDDRVLVAGARDASGGGRARVDGGALAQAGC